MPSTPLPVTMHEPLVVVCETPESLARFAADTVSRLLWAARGRNPDAPVRVAISGGTTPYAMLGLLRAEHLPWSDTHWYWVDERFVPPDHPRSNVGAARKALFDHRPETHVHAPPTPADGTLEDAAHAYAARLDIDLPDGRFDIVLLGIGDDGHTASLFPGEPEVNERSRSVVSVPARDGREPRISLTRPVIERAETVLLLAQGASKQAAFRAMRQPSPVLDIPSRIVHTTKNPTLCLVDRAVVS